MFKISVTMSHYVKYWIIAANWICGGQWRKKQKCVKTGKRLRLFNERNAEKSLTFFKKTKKKSLYINCLQRFCIMNW